MRISLRNLSIGAATATVVGTSLFFMGANAAADAVRAQHAAEPKDIKIQTIERETIKIQKEAFMPESCARAVELAQMAHEHIVEYESGMGNAKRISDHLATAIMLKNVSQLNDAKSLLFKFDEQTAGPVAGMGNTIDQLKTANKQCIQDS